MDRPPVRELQDKILETVTRAQTFQNYLSTDDVNKLIKRVLQPLLNSTHIPSCGRMAVLKHVESTCLIDKSVICELADELAKLFVLEQESGGTAQQHMHGLYRRARAAKWWCA